MAGSERLFAILQPVVTFPSKSCHHQRDIVAVEGSVSKRPCLQVKHRAPRTANRNSNKIQITWSIRCCSKSISVKHMHRTGLFREYPSPILPHSAANLSTSFARAVLPCLVMMCTRFEVASASMTTTTATENCQMFGLLLLVLISLTFIP